MAFLDFRKAFDTVWRNGLLTVAWNLGIRGRVWNILNSLYQNVQCNVKMGDIVTDFFDIEGGVKQGCVLSPILFCLYINELSKMLNEHDVGIHIMGVNIKCLFWADDVVLLADNDHDLQRMLNIAAEFSHKWRLNFNHDKSNILITGKRINNHKLWQLGDDYISEVNTYKYLGVHISRNLSDHMHLNETIKKGNRLIGYIKSIINSQDDFNRVYYGDVLWRSVALPTINYAFGVSSYSASDYKLLDNLQLQMARAILGAPRNTPAAALLGDLGWSELTCTHDKVKIRFFSRLKNMDLNRWPKLLLNALFIVSNQSGRDLNWKWLNSIRNILSDNNLSSMFNANSEINETWLKGGVWGLKMVNYCCLNENEIVQS